MKVGASDIVVGLMMVVFAIIGLVLGAGAMDDEMYVFGIALFLFAVLFIFGQIRRVHDRADARKALKQ